MALELYPLVTDKGYAIPLEVARPLSSIAVASGSVAINLLELGSIISVYSPKLVRVAITSDSAPDLEQEILPNSFFLPPGAIAQFEAQGTNVAVKSMDGTLTYLYLTLIETWRSMSREQALING